MFYGRSGRAAGTAELRANVLFNYPVRPADLRPPPQPQPGGRPVAFTLTAAEPDKTLALTINQEVKSDQPLLFEVAAGLAAVAGSQATTASLQAEAEVPNQQTLQVRELTGQVLDGTGRGNAADQSARVGVRHSALLKVAPAVPYEIERAGKRAAAARRLRGGQDLPGSAGPRRARDAGRATGGKIRPGRELRGQPARALNLPALTRRCICRPTATATWRCGSIRWRTCK
ncbi:MAG: hypothetical protein WKG07_10150 [Hymenobacter sp.]